MVLNLTGITKESYLGLKYSALASLLFVVGVLFGTFCLLLVLSLVHANKITPLLKLLLLNILAAEISNFLAAVLLYNEFPQQVSNLNDATCYSNPIVCVFAVTSLDQFAVLALFAIKANAKKQEPEPEVQVIVRSELPLL